MKTLSGERLEMICEWFQVDPSDVDYIGISFHGVSLPTDEASNQRQMFAGFGRDRIWVSGNYGIKYAEEGQQ